MIRARYNTFREYTNDMKVSLELFEWSRLAYLASELDLISASMYPADYSKWVIGRITPNDNHMRILGRIEWP